ncbi:adenylylsulfatase HINT3-like isoform X2 [Phragmites australis]|uniref:adenylylsulfatase HINT3-like isoform X2 n=1 Tax=Phragmites australis TaxID=29695 RepID=UPI002D76DABB|nr:adenylylsulfatase HINT3-like isoform X2 [Phragmites australis]
MTTPSPSGSPALERRLAVLLSHLHPSAGAAPPTARIATAAATRAAAEAGLSRSPCDGGGWEGELSAGGYCVFCNIVAGTSQTFKLYEDDVCLCILDAKPLTAGHSLIIPKSHYPSLQTTPPTTNSSLRISRTKSLKSLSSKLEEVLAAICSKLPLLSTAIMKATQCDAFNVLINNGEKAGQVIFHTHIHIIPRSKDDNLWSSETYSRNPLSHNQETKNLVSCIKEVLSSSSEDYSTVTLFMPWNSETTQKDSR